MCKKHFLKENLCALISRPDLCACAHVHSLEGTLVLAYRYDVKCQYANEYIISVNNKGFDNHNPLNNPCQEKHE